MIEKIDAINRAKDYFHGKGNKELLAMYSSPDLWIMFGGFPEKEQIGNIPIAIDKKSGEISNFVMTDTNNMNLILSATEEIIE